MDKLEKFWASARSITLTGEEKALMRDEVYAETVAKSDIGVVLNKFEKKFGKKEIKRFIKSHPIEVVHTSIFDLFISMKFAATAVIAAIVITSVGGGVAYAAENSMPGDVLYAIKINFTEPLRENIRFDPDIRARWAEKRLKRRLSETEALMSKGLISERQMARMQDRIAKHHYRLERRMKNLQEGPEDIQKHLDRRMQEHIAFLSAIESGQVPMPTYLGKVRGHAAKHKVHIQVIRNR